MTIFLSGGSKNGKSTLGERAARALAGEGPLWYVATMIPHDEEDGPGFAATGRTGRAAAFRRWNRAGTFPVAWLGGAAPFWWTA